MPAQSRGRRQAPPATAVTISLSALRRRRPVGSSEWNDVTVVTSTSASEPLALLGEGEDHGMQDFRALFQFRVLPTQTGNFLVGTRTFGGRSAGGRWRHALLELLSELVTQVAGTI